MSLSGLIIKSSFQKYILMFAFYPYRVIVIFLCLHLYITCIAVFDLDKNIST